MAEGEGFEPPEPFGSAVFKTAAIDHSATLPFSYLERWRICERVVASMASRARTPDANESGSEARESSAVYLLSPFEFRLAGVGSSGFVQSEKSQGRAASYADGHDI